MKVKYFGFNPDIVFRAKSIGAVDNILSKKGLINLIVVPMDLPESVRKELRDCLVNHNTCPVVLSVQP